MLLNYSTVLPRDFEFSGPEIWPCVSAQDAWDRYIHRRPELAYLRAKRELNKSRSRAKEDLAEYIEIRMAYGHYQNGSRQKWEQLQKWSRLINRDDESADVREFLDQLRDLLKRHVPNQPLPDCRISLRFHDPTRGGANAGFLTSWQETWL